MEPPESLVHRLDADNKKLVQELELAKDELAARTAQLDETLDLKDELHRQRQQLRDELAELRKALEGSQTLNGVDAARVAQTQQELELAKDELAALTTRFDEAAKELTSMREFAVKPMRESILRLGARNRKALALLMDTTRAPALMASEAAVILDPIDLAHIVDDAAIMRQAAYELIEAEWNKAGVTQAIRIPGPPALAWHANGFAALNGSLISAVDKFLEIHSAYAPKEQKGDKEP